MSSGTPRRRSIFSGLLLIVIGVLFFLHYHVPGLGIGHLFLRYWPVLLIVWGLARLFDYFASQRTGQSSPPLLSGGEIGLIILLFFVGFGIWAGGWINDQDIDWGPWMGHTASATEEIPAQPVKAGAKIRVSTDRGNITVHAEADNNLRVIVSKTVWEMSDSEADRRLQDMRVLVTPTADGFEIRPNVSKEIRTKVDLEIHVPKQVSIVASTNNGDFSASDVTGGVSLNSRSGGVEIHDVTGDVNVTAEHGDLRISGVHGDVRLSGHGSEVDLSDVTGDATIESNFYGPIRVSNVAKTMRYTSSISDLTIEQLAGRMELNPDRLEISDTRGSVDVRTTNKDVAMENIAGRVKVTDRHGDIELQLRQPPHDEIDLTDDSGQITLTLPSSSMFEIIAASKSGDVQSDFEDPTLKTTSEGETNRLEGKVGAHGPQIRLSTSYGTISIRKGSAQPTAAKKPST